MHLQNKVITICNTYNQPSKYYHFNRFTNIFNNFPQPILVVGDFNAHHPLWDEGIIDANCSGTDLEEIITNNNYCCLNESDIPTYFSKTHNSFSSIDLTFCSSSITDSFEWNVTDDSYSSDHYPIIISYLDEIPLTRIPKFNYSKTDWGKYHLLTKDIPDFIPSEDHNEQQKFIQNFIIDAANKSIPIIKGDSKKRTVPWWSIVNCMT